VIVNVAIGFGFDAASAAERGPDRRAARG
jgi:hypothetical protein